MRSGHNYDFDNYLEGETLIKGEQAEELLEGIRTLLEKEDYTPGW